MAVPKCIGYRVEVLAGSRGCDPIAFGEVYAFCDEIRRDCGHIHRTAAAADRCRLHLLGYSKDRRTCSAAWYNARVYRVYEGYEDTHLAL